MSLFDKSIFNQEVVTTSLEIPTKHCNTIRILLKNQLINQDIKKWNPIQKSPINGHETSHKIIVLCMNFDPDNVPLNVTEFYESHDIPLRFIPFKFIKTFYDFTTHEILKRLLPPTVTIPTSFETVGHIAHFNLIEDQLPYKHLIGQVFLEKLNKQIRTIVNKTGNIETEFRTFPMEILAGEQNTVVETLECGARLKFNYATVYWNSRLQYEHKRIIDLLKPGDIVCDMMCGIGPFAIPAALKGCYVYANDLNPESYKYLVENIKKNKVQKFVKPTNKCGRIFMRELMTNLKFQCSHIIMNLPATAIEFLDVFQGGWKYESTPPLISCYCFSRELDQFENDIIHRVEEVLHVKLDLNETHVQDVRDVGPNKKMACITFRLPRSS